MTIKMNNDPERLRKLAEMDDGGCVSVGGLAVESGATFNKEGQIEIRKGDQVDLVIDIPRLGLKSGVRCHVDVVRGENLFEIGAWDCENLRRVEVVVERNWIVPVLPRKAVKKE